eukprot:360326-Pyramimonas_sp.AAC.1
MWGPPVGVIHNGNGRSDLVLGPGTLIEARELPQKDRGCRGILFTPILAMVRDGRRRFARLIHEQAVATVDDDQHRQLRLRAAVSASGRRFSFRLRRAAEVQRATAE